MNLLLFGVCLVRVMKNESCVDDVEVKKANIRHHDVEAEFFEQAHPEGSSVYERAKVSESIAFIAKNSSAKDLCVDVGCGTGFVASFELPLYKTVVAMDISRKMLETVRNKFGHSINIVLCDAESLPLKNEIADLVSASSVLHHLPKPFNSISDVSRVIKQDGFFYISREPNLQRLRRFFDFFDTMVVGKLAQGLAAFKSELSAPRIHVEGLNYTKADIHYPTGFHVMQLAEFLDSEKFKVILAYSYHWIYPDSYRGLLGVLMTKINFAIEKIPLSRKFGRYITIVAKKRAQRVEYNKT
jgi:SAM-dependent methyltransferase